jgi:type I restriction enzyme M protein
MGSQEARMSSRISQQQLESYLWGAATLLRGTIDAGDYKQFIFPLLFYKRLCDVFDEETQAALRESGGDKAFAAYPENHRFQIPQDAHWRESRQVAKNVGHALQTSMRAIETANPDKLYGIFGDAQWTNKDRLSDAMLRNLVEHFNSLDLSITNLPEDELGQGYEYLIKKFADDSGHTAAEFYTNRTVVHLMTEMLQPEPGESIYDPTCGSGGMLLSCITQVRRQGKEWRNVRLYGQERNLMTSSIARMNCFLHGIEDFQIVRGDTLSEPKFVRGDHLMRFDVVLANPPYSIKQWDRQAFASDPWGRNLYGTPPQGRADYAFWQHILCSLDRKNGRCAILFPHGVLFRQEEGEMRRKLVEADVIECVLGLGPNLFYNSPMEACVVICLTNKPKAHRRRILFINAVNEVTRERAQSFLTDEHIRRIVTTYFGFTNKPGFARVATSEEVAAKDFSLSIPLFVEPDPTNAVELGPKSNALYGAVKEWLLSSRAVLQNMQQIIPNVNLRGRELAVSGNADFQLLTAKPDWKRVRFGDVVKNVNETETHPAAAGIQRYIGLEHLEPGSLHIQTWGNISKGTTFIRRCRPGQVLFGKRRAYQRKVAVAEFDAVVSGDIYVLSPSDGQLLPDLLPAICLSQRFYRHAVGTSAGSLSPRTNWTSLSDFEFELPPPDLQRRIASTLGCVDKNIESWNQFCLDVGGAIEAFLLSAINRKHAEWRSVTLGAACEIVSDGEHLSPKFLSFGIPILSAKDILESGVTFSEARYISEKAAELSWRRCRPVRGDILIVSRGATIGRSTRVDTDQSFALMGSVIQLRMNESIALNEFVAEFLRLPSFQRKLLATSGSSAQQAIYLTDIKNLALSVPPVSEQESICKSIGDYRQTIAMTRRHIATLTALRSALIAAME